MEILGRMMLELGLRPRKNSGENCSHNVPQNRHIDDLYGSLDLTFVPDFTTHNIQLRVLYNATMIVELRPAISRARIGISGGGNVTFQDLHLKHLQLPNLVFPFRRALLRHARSAYDVMHGNFRPHDVGAGTAPSEEQWGELFAQCASESACGECEYFEAIRGDDNSVV
jgi:hypothetical protein